MAELSIIRYSMQLKILIHPSNMVDRSVCKNGIGYAIEKADSSGVKRKFLAGVSSGIQVDGHGDRMSEKCIKDFIAQTQEKDILLYANHGRVFTHDIGRLTKSEITKTGDWYTEYQLYDEKDDVSDANRQEAAQAWKQANGLAPYSKPKQFGFSIEGYIPDGQVVRTETGMEIGKVDLDPGVSLVSKPAYTSSVASAITKALKKKKENDPDNRDAEEEAKDGLPEEQLSNIIPEIGKSLLDEKMRDSEETSEYWDGKWRIESAFNDAIRDILSSTGTPEEKQNLLNETFDAYKEKMISLFASIGFQTDTDGQIQVTLSENKTAIAKEAIRKLLIGLQKENSMPEDIKTMLTEVMATLHMILDAENKEADPAEQQGSEIMNALKALSRRMKKEDTEDKKEEKAEDDKVEEKAEDKKDDAEMKALLKKLSKLLTRKEGEGSGSENAGKIIDDEQPEKPEAESGSQKAIKALIEAVGQLANKMNGIEKGFDSMLSGFIEESPEKRTSIQKGAQGNLGEDALINALLSKLAKKANETDSVSGHSDDPIRKNKAAFAEFFRKGR